VRKFSGRIPKLISRYSEDEITGVIVAVVIIGAMIAASVVLFYGGWHGNVKPFTDSIRPEAAQLAKTIISWAFAVAVLVIGTRKISDVPYTARVYGVVFIMAVLICGTNDWLDYSEGQRNFWELMDVQQTIKFVAPTVIAYFFGSIARIWLQKAKKPKN